MKTPDVAKLKRVCPMPQLLHRMGLGEFAKRSVRSPFREDRRPSWGIFQRDGKWFFKDQATGESGDEITLLARWKGLDEKRDFPAILKLYAELAGVRVNEGTQPRRAERKTKSFDWSRCIAAFTAAEVEKLAQWRGYSPEFCVWLVSQRLIGLHNGNVALPVHDGQGVVIGTHYRLLDASWRYEPTGISVTPLVFGGTKDAESVFIFESPWDAFAVMDKLGWHAREIPPTAIVITRGAGNGKLVAGLVTPEANVFAFRQNDETKNGKNAADEWLADVCAHTSGKVFHVATPVEFKDANDWTRAGARAENIVAALDNARPVELPVPRVTAGETEARMETESVIPASRWPDRLAPAALHGVAGELVALLDPHTEADPAAILFQLLGAFGNVIGRTAHFTVEGQRHCSNMNVVLVGNTAKGRKGISWGRVGGFVAAIDQTWRRPASGMSTGEGLIWAVRDPIEQQEPIKEKGKVTGYQTVVVDKGEEDKRLLVVEEEFSRPLKCANREHNTLSAVLRQAYDTGNLRILTKNSPATATAQTRTPFLRHCAKRVLRA